MKAGLTIGEIAKELQINPRTVRYYEEVGLLPEPRRSESGYRVYSDPEIERLRLVRRAKLLGLTLAEIKEIVEYAVDGRCGATRARLLSLVETKLGEIDRKIEDLIKFRDNLKQYHSELSAEIKSEVAREGITPPTDSCTCVGKEIETLTR